MKEAGEVPEDYADKGEYAGVEPFEEVDTAS